VEGPDKVADELAAAELFDHRGGGFEKRLVGRRQTAELRHFPRDLPHHNRLGHKSKRDSQRSRQKPRRSSFLAAAPLAGQGHGLPA
jgi:hypothetical protein